MCLAVPGKILEISDSGDQLFRIAKVNFGGVMKDVNLSMLSQAKKEDYILVHAGVALSIIDEKEANETIEYLTKMGEWSEKGSNVM
jgi:hydrogenase expression/formation protein HypC